jgi:hypothetical protein
MPIKEMQQSPKKRFDTAHAAPRAFKIVAQGIHHGTVHDCIHKAAKGEE